MHRARGHAAVAVGLTGFLAGTAAAGYVLDATAEHFPEHVRLSRLTFIGNQAAVYNLSGSATFTITDSLLLGNDVAVGSEQEASAGTLEVRSSLFMGNRRRLLLPVTHAP